MKKPELIREVQTIASALRAAGAKPMFRDDRAGWAMTTWNHIQKTRPDLTRHLRRHYKPDPYQHMKGWMPYWASR